MYLDYIKVPEKFIGLVIGKKGSNLKRIEIKTNTIIIFHDDGFYIHSSKSEDDIVKAKNKILLTYQKKMEKDTCPICLETIDFSKDCVTTQCGHRFHFTCLQTSLKKNNNCPMCRQKLKEEDTIDYEKIMRKTITQVRRTNYAYYLTYYLENFYSFQLVVEEFLKEPIRYALTQI